jgi:hypothetical protein
MQTREKAMLISKRCLILLLAFVLAECALWKRDESLSADRNALSLYICHNNSFFLLSNCSILSYSKIKRRVQ